jgi:Tfp pilus assembly protein PilV
MERTNNNSGMSGFTLIETLIAVCIIGLGILVFMHSQISGMSGASSSRVLNHAVSIAQSKINDLLLQRYMSNELAGNTTGKFHDLASNTTQDQSIDNILYNLSWQVIDNYPIPNCKEITTTIKWTYKGEPFSISLTTDKANAI